MFLGIVENYTTVARDVKAIEKSYRTDPLCDPSKKYDRKMGGDSLHPKDCWADSIHGKIPDVCPGGYHNVGATCWADSGLKSAGFASCADDRYKNAGLCYLKNCPPSYRREVNSCVPDRDYNNNKCGIGSCIVSKATNCPPGYKFVINQHPWTTKDAGGGTCAPLTDEYCQLNYGPDYKIKKFDDHYPACVKCPRNASPGYADPDGKKAWECEVGPVTPGGPTPPVSGYTIWNISSDRVLKLDSDGYFIFNDKRLVYGQDANLINDSQLDIPGVGRIQFKGEVIGWAGFNGINFYNINPVSS
jgi:hypothetical protein